MLLVEHLHLLSDGLPVRQDVAQVPGAQHIPQGGGGQQPGGPAVVVHVGHGADRVLEHQIFLNIEYIFFECSRYILLFYNPAISTSTCSKKFPWSADGCYN